MRVVLATLSTLICAAAVQAQSVIVPETTLAAFPTLLTNASTVLTDPDSAFIVYTEGEPPSMLGVTKFTIVNLNSGAVEIPPTPLADGYRSAVATLLQPDAVLVVTSNDNCCDRSQNHAGNYFVINPISGEVLRGPVPFTGPERDTYRTAAAAPSRVVVAYRTNLGPVDQGRFTIIDPLSDTIVVPETVFTASTVNTLDLVPLTAERIAIVYTPLGTGELRYVIVDAHTGAVVVPPAALPSLGSGSLGRVLRLNTTTILIDYVTEANTSVFATLNTASGEVSTPTVYSATGGVDLAASPSLLGAETVFFPFAPQHPFGEPGQFAVYRLDGSQRIAPTIFNPNDSTFNISTVASECRVLIAYRDGTEPDGISRGKFQVLDFSDVCGPPVCPPDITGLVNIYQSGFFPFFIPALQVQFVLVHNPTPVTLQGPFALAFTDLQNGIPAASGSTTCLSPTPVSYITLPGGTDEALTPNDATGGFLLFWHLAPEPIMYRPTILARVPLR